MAAMREVPEVSERDGSKSRFGEARLDIDRGVTKQRVKKNEHVIAPIEADWVLPRIREARRELANEWVAGRIRDTDRCHEREKGVRREESVLALRTRNMDESRVAGLVRSRRERRPIVPTQHKKVARFPADEMLERPDDVWVATARAQEHCRCRAKVEGVGSKLKWRYDTRKLSGADLVKGRDGFRSRCRSA